MDDVRFTMQGNIAGFHSPNKREGWQMDVTEIAIIALQYDDVPDFGFNQTFLFITTTKRVFKIDISKIQEMAAFDLFWQTLTARLQTDILYQREFWPGETVVVYPRQLQGERLYEDWNITSGIKIILYSITHLFHPLNRLLNKKVRDHIVNWTV